MTSTPATPIATSVVPWRKGRPNESVTIDADVAARPLAELARAAGRRTRRVDGAAARASRARARSRVDARRGADEAVVRLGDHERRSLADDPVRLAEDDLDLRAGSPSSPAISRARADGSIPSSETTRPSTFETAFWATTTTSRRRVDPLDDHRREVVALAHLREPLDRDDRDRRHRPAIRTPAWAR